LSREPFNESAPVQRLLHFIRQEKPYFQPVIDPPDVKKILCVRTKMSNARIVSQAGAFLLFGLEAQLGPGDEQGIRVDKVIIDGGSKRTILSELDSLNINESTVFPHIEKSAQYIAGRYGE